MTDETIKILEPDDLRLFLRTIEMATPEQIKTLGAEAADHIDAQAATIKALVVALDHYACDCGDMCEQLNGTCGDTARAALDAAKEPT